MMNSTGRTGSQAADAAISLAHNAAIAVSPTCNTECFIASLPSDLCASVLADFPFNSYRAQAFLGFIVLPVGDQVQQQADLRLLRSITLEGAFRRGIHSFRSMRISEMYKRECAGRQKLALFCIGSAPAAFWYAISQRATPSCPELLVRLICRRDAAQLRRARKPSTKIAPKAG